MDIHNLPYVLGGMVFGILGTIMVLSIRGYYRYKKSTQDTYSLTEELDHLIKGITCNHVKVPFSRVRHTTTQSKPVCYEPSLSNFVFNRVHNCTDATDLQVYKHMIWNQHLQTNARTFKGWSALVCYVDSDPFILAIYPTSTKTIKQFKKLLIKNEKYKEKETV